MTFEELLKQLSLLKSPSGDGIKKWCEENLSKAGDVLSAPNEYGMTPLHRAAVQGDLPVLTFLLSLGADPSINNLQQQTPLFSALILPMAYNEGLKEDKISCFRKLRERVPLALSQRDSSGDTVLQRMAIHGYSSLMNELLAVSPEISLIPNKRKIYPIHTAILNQEAECVSILLQQKDAEQLSDIKGRGALHYAAYFGTAEIVMRCCDVLKNLNPLDARGVTPLMLAAEAGNMKTLDALIIRGADPTLTDFSGRNILDIAKKAKQEELVSWIQEHVPSLAKGPSHLS